MDIKKFEEKALEIIKEHNMYVPCDNEVKTEESMFRVSIISFYKEKSLVFGLFGLNCFSFEVRATDFDDLFEKSLRVLKGYTPKSTRERSKTEEQVVSN